LRYRVERGGVVGAVAARLHDHVLRKPEIVAQGEKLLRSGILGDILGLRAERELRHRTEHVAMRIHRAGRRGVARLRRVRMPAYDAFVFFGGHANTVPSISLRAVRRSAELITSPASSTSSRQLISPVGCSTLSVLRLPSGIVATSFAGEPSSRLAVATLTAASTPMVAWARWGMKLRVQIAPPALGGATRNILGTDFSFTSPRFI